MSIGEILIAGYAFGVCSLGGYLQGSAWSGDSRWLRLGLAFLWPLGVPLLIIRLIPWPKLIWGPGVPTEITWGSSKDNRSTHPVTGLYGLSLNWWFVGVMHTPPKAQTRKAAS